VRSPLRVVGASGSVLAAGLTAHTAWNLTRLRTPPPDPPPVAEVVSVLLPVRDEAERVGTCLRSVLGQQGVADLEVVVLDDRSTDGTPDVVRAVAGGDPRVRLLQGRPLPEGWLGKPHACAQLAEAARGTVYVYVDADVVLEPHAVASTVSLMREARLDLVCPYPRQLADGLGPRLVQPLLQWSWLTTLPLGVAERSPRESLSAANGQFLAVDAKGLRRAGGWFAVRGEVLDDVALLRVVKRMLGRGTVADGTHLARCRMYDGWADLREGYTKSLWSAFGSPAGAVAVTALLWLAYVAPPVAALVAGSRTGALGYAAGVAGRLLVARRTGQRVWPDTLAHPVSVVLLGWLTAQSWHRRRRGELTWKGRRVG
jgi:Glycosyl transferase family 2